MRIAALALAALVGTGASPRAEDTPAADATALVNRLLGSLMGGGDVTGEQLQREVAEVGGIPFRRDVPIAFMTHAELVEYLQELLESEYPADLAEADERMLRGFDLLPSETDLRSLRARLLEENVVGFYDERPHRRRLYAISEQQAFTPMNQIVLAHELRHALQDQYEPLHLQLPNDVGAFDDRHIAWMSLLEGDATLVMERVVLARVGALGLGDMEGLGGGLGSGSYSDVVLSGLADVPGAPPVIRDHLVMPYLVGRDLALAIEEREGAAGMQAAWRRPPDSTEQVLHPEKFFAREAPRPVTPGQAPAGGTLLAEGVLGEMLLRSLIEGEDAADAAAGWGGDRWRLFDVDGATALVWASAWDSPAEAVEFEEALRARFARRQGSGGRRGGWAVFEGAADWRFGLRRQGDRVELVSSDDGDAFAPLLSR